MLRNYLTIAYRNLLKNKVFSLINILGLAIGMAACLLISQYVQVELSYDDFHEQQDQIYRIRFDEYRNGILGHSSAGSSPGVGPAMKREFPEVEEVVRLCQMDHLNHIFTYKNVVIGQQNVFVADASFFKVFSYQLLKGNRETALQAPWQVVITQATAKKYFKDEDPIGKQIFIHHNYGEGFYMVTGLMEDFPQNTHLNAEVLISYASLVAEDQAAETSWNWNAFLTYLLLKPGTNIQALEQKFPRLIQTYKGKALAGTHVRWKLSLQALRDIHLNSNLKFEAKVNGSGKSVFILSGVGILILIIAWVNYINLTTAKAIDRAKEVGIRKVVGSQRKQLILQFLTESFFLNSLSLLVAFSLLQVGLPFFEKLTGYDLSFTLLTNFQYWSGILLVFAAGTILAAFYPAWVLSGLKPVAVLKGKFGFFKSGARLRKSLVVFQFAISLLLISGSLVVYKQITYMQNRDLGMNIDQILVFKTQNIFPKDADLEKSIQTFKQTLLQNPSIRSVTTSSTIPGEAITWATNDFRKAGTAFTHANDFAVMSADHDFANVFDLQLLAGRFFVAHLQSDSNAVVINETALEALGFKNPQSAINEVIISDDFRFKHHIIGVVKDFNQQSLKSHYRPIIITYQQVWFNNYYEVKINAENVHETITKVKATYDAVFPGNPFDYFFLDDFFNHQYKADVQFGKVFTLFTGLAIFIACLGLIGLSSFTIIQRTKEIGVRKVLGASVPDIVFLLNKDLIKLILLGTFIAWPIAYWGTYKWLQNYAFRIQINYWFMLLPAIIVIIISLLAVSVQTLKAANANPVKSLRNE